MRGHLLQDLLSCFWSVPVLSASCGSHTNPTKPLIRSTILPPKTNPRSRARSPTEQVILFVQPTALSLGDPAWRDGVARQRNTTHEHRSCALPQAACAPAVTHGNSGRREMRKPRSESIPVALPQLKWLLGEVEQAVGWALPKPQDWDSENQGGCLLLRCSWAASRCRGISALECSQKERP